MNKAKHQFTSQLPQLTSNLISTKHTMLGENHQLDSPGLPKVIHWKALMLTMEALLSAQFLYHKWVKVSKIKGKACMSLQLPVLLRVGEGTT